jgi:hypothetical protein
MNNERWLPIAEFEGYYEVSDLGRVQSLDREICNGKSTRLRKGRIIIPGCQNNGYLQTPLWKDNKGVSILVHRLVALAFLPNPQNKEFVNHLDGHKQNNVLSNLEWVTRKENHEHAARLGLLSRGESHYACKLTYANVTEIRRLAECGIRNKYLAAMFNISPSVTCGIVKGRNRVNF